MHILYEDLDLIVIEKPAGVPVETSRIGTADLVSLLKNHLASQPGKGGIPYLGVIHRLDQPVQGVMVFAKNQKAAAALSGQISKGSMTKTYLAVVTGICGERDTLSHYLVKDGRTNCSRIVPEGTKGAKAARLEYERMGVLEAKKLSLVKIHLFTGRHHQIRVQMAGAGFPLYGDQKYNPAPIEGSIALCASELTFRHPSTGKRMTFSCEPRMPIFQEFRTE